MKIKKDDVVKVIAGKDKGKVGKVLRVLPRENRVIVENVNIVTRHVKPRGPQNPGGITKSEAPIHVSNVMYFDQKNNKVSRIGYEVKNGKKVRVLRTSGATID